MTQDAAENDLFAWDRRLDRARERRLARLGRLDALGQADRVIVYGFGMRGEDLARQLRDKGVEPLVFDNAESSRRAARAAGFGVTDDCSDADIPLVIGAGQNQIEIRDSLSRPAFSLHDALFAFDLRDNFGRARQFTFLVDEERGRLLALAARMDPASAERFIQVLEYRQSLDPADIPGRFTFEEMWRPPVAGLDLGGFCDIGAFDGDSLAAVKGFHPELVRSLTIEPNPLLKEAVARTAERLGVSNRHFVGAAWSEATRLAAVEAENGFFIMQPGESGDILARPLDEIAGEAQFDYVKMDVEATEAMVMAGGARTLAGARCVAVAAYHLPRDLLDLPDRMDAIRPDWRIAFAHNSQVFADSIFYFWRGMDASGQGAAG